MTKEQVAKLKSENEQLKSQVGDLAKQLEELKQKFTTITNAPSAIDDQVNSNSLQFLSDKYDDLKAFKEDAAKELASFTQRLFNIEQKLLQFDEALESMLKYSYKYNVKIIGIAQEGRVESSKESVEICLKLFKALGAKVEERDIDIAHRVKSRNTNFPPPIVCKFSRRLARESVMANKKKLGSLNLEAINISSTGRLGIVDHLTPRAQELYHKVKVFQKENDYAFCWTKNGDVLLKQFEDSKIIKVADPSVLLRLPKLTKDLPSRSLSSSMFQQQQQQFDQYIPPRTRSSQRH